MLLRFGFSDVLASKGLLFLDASQLDICGCPVRHRRASTERQALMRIYPCNSPEAAARLVALVLIADGHVCRSEVDMLERLDAARELGLAPDAMPKIIQTLCEDLLLSADASGSMVAHLDESALAALMAEVTDASLQAKVLDLATAVANADHHLADGESLVLVAASRHWRGAKAQAVPRARPLARQVS